MNQLGRLAVMAIRIHFIRLKGGEREKRFAENWVSFIHYWQNKAASLSEVVYLFFFVTGKDEILLIG